MNSLFGSLKSKPSGRVRRPVRFQPGSGSFTSNLEVLERRDVPAVVYGPLQFSTSPYVSATISETGNQVTATYTVIATPPQAIDVGLAVYSIQTMTLTPSFSGSPQTRILNVTGDTPLTTKGQTETITVNLPPGSGVTTEDTSGQTCMQADAYWFFEDTPNPAGLNMSDTDTQGIAARDTLNSHLLAALVDCETAPSQFVGLTPGYYKNHTGAITYQGRLSLDTTLADLFGNVVNSYNTDSGQNLGSLTVLQALDFQGGPTLADKAQILLRQAVAGYLNATYGGYPLSASQVVSEVNSALSSFDPNVITNLANTLDGFNNLGGLNLTFANTTAGNNGHGHP